MESYLTKDILDHTATVEVTEDFELPEYQPEVRRTAGVRCVVTRDNGFLEENRAEVSGSVLYTVVYLTGEGGMASVPLYSPWQMGIPLPQDEGLGVEDLYITAEAENVTCRITGPRKLTLSARVRVRCLAIGQVDCTMVREETEGGEPVCRTAETPVVTMKTCRHTGTVSGETAGSGGEGAVITCQGAVRIGEVRRVPEGIAVSGEGVVRLLVLGENGSYIPLRCRVAIAETLPLPRKKEEVAKEICHAWGTCASLSVTATQDGRIRWEMEYDLEGAVLCEDVTTRAVDGYSLAYGDTPHFRQTEAVTGGRFVRCQVSIGAEKTVQADNAGDLQCIYGWGTGRFEKGERLGGGRYMLTGTALCTLILTGNGDLVTEEVSLPVRCEWDGGDKEGEGTEDFRCRFAIGDVTGHMDGNLLRVQAEAYGDGILLRRADCGWLYRLEEHTDRPLPQRQSAIVLYTPEEGEDEWAVRKRYRTADVVEQGGRYVVRR